MGQTKTSVPDVWIRFVYSNDDRFAGGFNICYYNMQRALITPLATATSARRWG
jgi:hypothetical protein